MRYTKGKWKASHKDTWSVETTLNKIVLAHITKLYDSLKKYETHGVPNRYMEIQAKIDGVEESYDADITKADKLRFKDLEELMWVFGDNEPNIKDYDFTYNWHFEDLENGKSRLHMGCTNREECNRYTADLTAYNERKENSLVNCIRH